MNIQEPIFDELPESEDDDLEYLRIHRLYSRRAALLRRQRRPRRQRTVSSGSDTEMESQKPTVPVQDTDEAGDGGSKAKSGTTEVKQVIAPLLEALIQRLLKPGESLCIHKSDTANSATPGTLEELVTALTLTTAGMLIPYPTKFCIPTFTS